MDVWDALEAAYEAGAAFARTQDISGDYATLLNEGWRVAEDNYDTGGERKEFMMGHELALADREYRSR